jgi:hypothetical protein
MLERAERVEPLCTDAVFTCSANGRAMPAATFNPPEFTLVSACGVPDSDSSETVGS